jgi:hypothetical protein
MNDVLYGQLRDYLIENLHLRSVEDRKAWFLEMLVMSLEESYLGEELTPLFHGGMSWGDKREFVEYALRVLFACSD